MPGTPPASPSNLFEILMNVLAGDVLPAAVGKKALANWHGFGPEGKTLRKAGAENEDTAAVLAASISLNPVLLTHQGELPVATATLVSAGAPAAPAEHTDGAPFVTSPAANRSDPVDNIARINGGRTEKASDVVPLPAIEQPPGLLRSKPGDAAAVSPDAVRPSQTPWGAGGVPAGRSFPASGGGRHQTHKVAETVEDDRIFKNDRSESPAAVIPIPIALPLPAPFPDTEENAARESGTAPTVEAPSVGPEAPATSVVPPPKLLNGAPAPRNFAFAAWITPKDLAPPTEENASPRSTGQALLDPHPIRVPAKTPGTAAPGVSAAPTPALPSTTPPVRTAIENRPASVTGTELTIQARVESTPPDAEKAKPVNTKPVNTEDPRSTAYSARISSARISSKSGSDSMPQPERGCLPVESANDSPSPHSDADDGRRRSVIEAAARRMGAQSADADGTHARMFVYGSIPGPPDRGIPPMPEERHAVSTPSEPKSETNPAVPSQPIREISLRLAQPDSSRVDIKLSERGGQTHVAVRTDDRELSKSLQDDLGVLVSRLEEKGYKTTTWTTGQRMDGDRGIEHASNPAAEGRFSSGQDGQNPPGGRDSQRRPRPQWTNAAANFRSEQKEADANDDRPS